MFLCSDIRKSGLVYRPYPLHALYAGAFEDERIIGVAGHAWNGMMLIQAPVMTEEITLECARLSGRPIKGLAGPLDQVRRARTALGLKDVPSRMQSDEWLYGLDLCDLKVPVALLNGEVSYRPPRPEEYDTLREWRLAYDVETLGAENNQESRNRASTFLDMQIDAGHVWVAVKDEMPVSLSAFNAALPLIVQLGGIYTPPELRGRGYAKASVAGSLLEARSGGALRSVLFTSNPDAARSYEALGFRRIGSYGLVLFR